MSDNRRRARAYLDVVAPHFHICRGRRPGGAFLQREAWPVREMVMNHLARLAGREGGR